MPKETSSASTGHRNKFLRGVQDFLIGDPRKVIRYLNQRKIFPDTAIERAFHEEKPLTPDDITISQLEMIVQICNTYISSGLYKGFTSNYVLANILDLTDGPLARKLGPLKPEGASKDATVDRLCDKKLAECIAKERGKYTYELDIDNLEKKLTRAFQLSTLTKAACEMCNVKTSEGGKGSMRERRTMLYFTLHDLGKLRTISSTDTILREKLLGKIDGNIKKLIDNSLEGAEERIIEISNASQTDITGWNNTKLNEPNSTAASEARKYVTVVLLNKALGMNIVETLNEMAAGKTQFPTAEYLIERYPYILKSLEAVDDFYQEALKIANITS